MDALERSAHAVPSEVDQVDQTDQNGEKDQQEEVLDVERNADE